MSFRPFQTAGHAVVYNKFRPSPPDKLVHNVLTFLKTKYSSSLLRAVDVGCGAGQSTKIWSPHFREVIGFDPSSSQITEAQTNNKLVNVKYQVGSAERINLPDYSAHLVTAAQSAHWFDLPKFYKEVERILVPGGVLAMYSYLLPRVRYGNQYEELCAIVDKFANVTLGNYQFPPFATVLKKYSGDNFTNTPFPVNRDESIFTESNGTLEDLMGFMSSLSAYQNYIQREGDRKGRDLLEKFENEFKDAICESRSPQEIQILIRHEYIMLLGAKL